MLTEQVRNSLPASSGVRVQAPTMSPADKPSPDLRLGLGINVIPVTWEAKVGGITVQGQLGRKLKIS
jgi:hypothetical protein